MTLNLKERINELEESRITIQELEVALNGLRSYESEIQRLRDLVQSKDNEINDVTFLNILVA
jgi:biopolymer transport protein ExbB/TolQ